MRGYAVYNNQGYDGYDFVQMFIREVDAQAAVSAGLGTDIEPMEIWGRPLEFKIRHTVTGRWTMGRPTRGIPLSGKVEWKTTWDEFVYWETFDGYDNLPEVRVTHSDIHRVRIIGLDKDAVDAAYLQEAGRWAGNRARLMDLSQTGKT